MSPSMTAKLTRIIIIPILLISFIKSNICPSNCLVCISEACKKCKLGYQLLPNNNSCLSITENCKFFNRKVNSCDKCDTGFKIKKIADSLYICEKLETSSNIIALLIIFVIIMIVSIVACALGVYKEKLIRQNLQEKFEKSQVMKYKNSELNSDDKRGRLNKNKQVVSSAREPLYPNTGRFVGRESIINNLARTEPQDPKRVALRKDFRRIVSNVIKRREIIESEKKIEKKPGVSGFDSEEKVNSAPKWSKTQQRNEKMWENVMRKNGNRNQNELRFEALESFGE